MTEEKSRQVQERFLNLYLVLLGNPVTGKVEVDLKAVGEGVVEVLHGALVGEPIRTIGHPLLCNHTCVALPYCLPVTSGLCLRKLLQIAASMVLQKDLPQP